jgi:outer membrane biosynthesis protein TonB
VNDERMRRISDALDAPGGLAADAELSAWLAEDLEALAYAQDLVRVDEVLRSLGGESAASGSDADWEAMAARIEQRLDDPLPPLEGFEQPPRFDDAEAERGPRVVGEDVSGRRAAAGPPPADANVVTLETRRRKGPLYWMGGLAAAAAVGLGITFGMVSLDAEPAAESAAATLPSAAWEELAQAPQAAPAPPAAVMAEAAEPMPAPPATAAPFAAPARAARNAEPSAAELPAELPAEAEVAAVDDMVAMGRPPLARRARAADRGAPPSSTLEPVQRPSRAAVLAALRSVEPTVQRCLQLRGEVARASIQVGADGSVVSVRVDPPYAGEEARCIVGAVRSARLPPSPEDYQVAHAFRPAPVAGGSLSGRPLPAARYRRAAPTRPPLDGEAR